MSTRIRKRCFFALAFLALSLGPALAAADDDAPKPTAPPSPCPASAPVEKQLVYQPNLTLLATGSLTLWLTYSASFATAFDALADDSKPGLHTLARSPSGRPVHSSAIGWLALPGPGPFLAAATVPRLSPNGPTDDRAFRAIMIADGALQTTSVGLLVLSGLTGKRVFVEVPRVGWPADPCEPEYTASAKRASDKGAHDLWTFPVLFGAGMLAVFQPMNEIVATAESRDHARLWALIPGPGAIVAAATLNPKAIRGSHHDRLDYALLGGVETAWLGVMASAPLWKGAPSVRAPDVKVGVGSASLTWKF